MIMGGVFVMETVSVMIQVASFKLTGKRVFRMAPLHHHFVTAFANTRASEADVEYKIASLFNAGG